MMRVDVDPVALAAGKPCWIIDGVAHSGFETIRGATFIRARDGQAWLDFDADTVDFRPGGLVLASASLETVHIGFNHLPAGQHMRLKATPGLVIGAVNQGNARAWRIAVTMYRCLPNGEIAHILCPSARFDGAVRTVTMRPPLPTPGPLNAWIEVLTDGRHNRAEALADW